MQQNKYLDKFNDSKIIEFPLASLEPPDGGEKGILSNPLQRAHFMDLPQSVLFACNHNAIRSPMAAAILRYLAGKRIYSRSGGVKAGRFDPFAVAAMEEIGIDISKHQPRTIEDLEDTSFDLIVTLAPEAHHKALELTRTMAVDVEYWPTLDPSAVAESGMGSREQILDAYRGVRDSLFRRIKERFPLGGGADI
jgi:protein-tyrosine-phosphatase